MGDIVVEGLDALCLTVVVVGMIDDVAVPEGVVGEDESSWTQNGEHHLVAVAIGSLVTIDEGHVEGDAELRGLREGVADDEADLRGLGRPFYPGTGEILHLVVDLEGVEVSVVW